MPTKRMGRALQMHGAPDTIAVSICDSQELSLRGLEWSLRDSGFQIVGTATRAESAIGLAARAKGAVVLVDLSLEPAPRGALFAIQAIAGAGGTVIATGVDGAAEPMLSAIRAGAMGYLTKDMPVQTFTDAIRAAARGEATLTRRMTAELLAEFRAQAASAPLAELLPSQRRLTEREWDVLERIASGMTNRGVAAELSISVETVRTHVSHILAKLEAPNRSAAAARYQQLRAAAGV
ncbi:MAG TPA: response regulator transcription factor [Gaiellales bacterium]